MSHTWWKQQEQHISLKLWPPPKFQNTFPLFLIDPCHPSLQILHRDVLKQVHKARAGWASHESEETSFTFSGGSPLLTSARALIALAMSLGQSLNWIHQQPTGCGFALITNSKAINSAWTELHCQFQWLTAWVVTAWAYPLPGRASVYAWQRKFSGC